MKVSFRPQNGFFKEVFLNLLLIFLTIGLYLPWGVTHIRRLVWSNIKLGDQRFYYLGNANELVKGYLVLIGGYLCWKLFSLLTEQYAEEIFFSILFTLPGAVLFFVLLYKAQLGSFKYQTRRTSYRGIRFVSTLPNLRKQYYDCFIKGVMTVFGFGIPYLFYYYKIEQIKLNSLRFGTQKFEFDLTFKAYFVLILKHLLCFLLAGMCMAYIYIKTLLFDESVLTYSGGAFLISSFILACVIIMHFLFSLFHLKINHLKTQDIHFESDLKFNTFLRMNLLNIPILFFSLGLALPIVLARNIGIFANSLQVNGMDQLDLINTNSEIENFDEILSQAFNLDVLDVF